MTAEAPAKASPARQILLVDDDPSFTCLLKDFLTSNRPGQWIVHTAEGYSSALAILKQHTVDLAVLDLNMPVMDGLQFLTLLKRSYPDLQVIILTARAAPESRNYCLQNGAALFLDKMDVADGFEKIYAAFESIASSSTEGFRGMLRQVGLTDVLQMECLNRKSSVLEITARHAAGRIFIEEGSIVHAEAGALQGEPALFQLLSLTGGDFQIKPFVRPTRLTIDGHWESLLMESARLQDEAASTAPPEPPVTAPAVETVPLAEPVPAPEPAPLPEEIAPAVERTIEEIVLCSGSGEVLYEWQSTEVERRARLLEFLATKSAAFGKLVPLGQTDRLEIEIPDGRIVAVLQPERKIFVRVSLKPI